MAYLLLVVLPITLICFGIFKWLTHKPDNVRCINPEAPVYMRRYVKFKKGEKQRRA